MRLPFTSSARRSHRGPPCPRTHRRLAYLERLEDRCLLTTVVPLFDAAVAEAEASDRQILTPSPAALGAVRGENFHFDVVYTTDPLHEQLSGIGFRMHYDSTQVTLDETATAATLFDAPIASLQVQNDTANSDDDTDTDKLLLVALASGVTPDFPGVGKLPATLLTAHFTASADFTGTTIRFSKSSTAPGFTLDAAPIQIVLTPNRAPTDIALSNLSVSENVPGADIGDVSVVDPDAGQTHSFTVSDNRFEIVDGKLRLQSGVSLDYEAAVTVPLDITATDSGTPAESYTESFVIDVQNANDPPSAIAISSDTVKEKVSGATVGVLSATDQDAGQTHVFTLVDPNSVFEIVNNTLKLKAGMFLELASGIPVQVGVTATDSGNPAAAITRTLPINVVSNPRPWRCPDDWLDVNADGQIVPFDVLYIINELNTPTVIGSDGMLPTARPANATYYYDTNGDRYCTPMDALWVINYLNDGLRSEGEYNGAPLVRNHTCRRLGHQLRHSERQARNLMTGSMPPSTTISPRTQASTSNRSTSPLHRDSLDCNDLVMDLESVLDDIAPIHE